MDMPILSSLEKKVLEVGYDGLSLSEKNDYIRLVASRKQKLVNQVTSEDLLDYHKEFKIYVFQVTCDTEIARGFTASNGHTYRTNREDQTNMLATKIQLSEDPTITEVYWLTQDAGYLMHTREEWLKVYNEAFEHKKALVYKNGELRRMIENATTDAELVAIKWENPFPPVTAPEPTPAPEEPETPSGETDGSSSSEGALPE
ncbi:hypothetical protein BSP36_089 [Bacillus phage BSP36]|uniref:DUF4376 domain-containing protein n=1 Tax=Bacillus phage BSP38 TaxID=2283013 RepID=A0A345MJV2_BPBSP|nr:tail fiber protein [Bacillus phage BSP38]AXH71134.1 hypothetical protein BSP38_092 [Bacillus phage BSP38]AYJ75176.1 hypothetical protein BSP36_089 [Bacillus phage BSP36]